MIRCIAALLLLIGAAGTAAAAGDDTSMRVVVRVVADSDRQLVSRIDGQVADLAVTLVRDKTRFAATSLQRRYERARALARRHSARVVVWFDSAGEHAVRVYVAEPGRDTLFARRVATADGSARAEAIAIVVRTTLRALAQGGRIGVRMPRSPATPEPPTRPLVPPPPPWHWHLGLQAQLSFDGESSPGQPGFMGRVGVARGRWHLGLVGVVGINDQLSDSMTTVHLARHSGGVGAALRILRRERAAVWLGLDAGLIAYTRSTTVVAGSLTPAPDSTNVAAFVSPLVRGQWRPLAGQGLWLTVELAADAVLGAPELRYEVGGMTVVRNQLWPVQPRLGVGIRLEGL